MYLRSANNRKNQTGFSMIEVILTLVVISAIVVFFTNAQQQSNKELAAKQTSEAMEDFTKMATDYLLANREPLIQAMTDGTGAANWCKINVNPTTGAGGTVANNVSLHTCAVDVSFLKFKNIVPQTYGELNQFKQKWTAIYRLVYADYAGTGTLTTEGSVEMLVVGARNAGQERAATADEALLTATIAGFTGGYVPNGQWGNCRYNAATKEACSISGGWNAPLNNFLNTP